MNQLSSETIHATCIAIQGRAVLIEGASGSGKSDLALRLIDRGASLVSDDYTLVQRRDGQVMASAPDRIAGRIEVRGVGIVDMPFVAGVPVAMTVQLHAQPPRLPDENRRHLLGTTLPVLVLNPFEQSAPIKVELAVRQLIAAQ
ncbi:HPr kinase/phosphatase C-terminal domain-containing protein [Sphingomonas sp. BGYR3]|uniref:HPr kinase/phosphorylase n=1 Tax=Sphingomonas sp. BGYR3 TaxID=2975483 RepID=UPI0021A2DB5D|nr:HPr kinase/phosphatase C-terminal domain-containing protein [Sphingomonas sp. BGYR3]MDG5487143.1 HPr kinase/phosphatase C-terminal domain-containing protein [Sphingomonas sp. BGYR3]